MKKPRAEKIKHSEAEANILVHEKRDRRILAHVPDSEKIRKNTDRRKSAEKVTKNRFELFAGKRYITNFSVKVKLAKNVVFRGVCIDLSQTGLLLQVEEPDFLQIKEMEKEEASLDVHVKLKIPKGALLEGMEKRVSMQARIVRINSETREVGLEFTEPLYRYFRHRSDRFMLSSASMFIFLLTAGILLMRYESVLYLRFARITYIYSIITAGFLLTRYLFGAFYRPIPISTSFTPGVTVIIPCFNEEEWISKTIASCVDQDYPVEQLEVIVVDDCSTDHSYEIIQKTLDEFYHEAERFKTKQRIKCVRLEKNSGKREAMAAGIRISTKELVAFVDSDSFLEPDAIRNLVQPFIEPKIHGVSGRTDVANIYTNSITKLQAVRYFIAFRIMKAAESYFNSVLCLSGPLSCYRKETVLENLDAWLGQRFLGQKATFGDDRALTHMILKHHQTVYQDTAICSTIVPYEQRVFLKQQMRWKRSWLRESFLATKFMWKKEPFMAISFYIGVLVPILAPIIVIYNMLYIPIVERLWPTTFMLGILFMAFMMSTVHLFIKKSSIWLYGLWFCLYYELILLWQMPWAWVTFWVSTWGTRMTPTDVAAKAKKDEKNNKKHKEHVINE